MRKNRILLTLLTVLLYTASYAQKVSPKAIYTDADGNIQEVTTIDNGEAPLEVTFKAYPEDMDDLTPSFVCRFHRQGDETDLMVRYEEDTFYRFTESGTFDVSLAAYNGETLLDSASVQVTISESRLEFPNAFSPNDDKINDIYGARGVNNPEAQGHWKSIVEFHGYIFNRWGQKLFEWTDVSKGWDGTYKGNPVKEGVYFLLVKAKGADGKKYNIRKDINLLRGYIERDGSAGSSTE